MRNVSDIINEAMERKRLVEEMEQFQSLLETLKSGDLETAIKWTEAAINNLEKQL